LRTSRKCCASNITRVGDKYLDSNQGIFRFQALALEETYLFGGILFSSIKQLYWLDFHEIDRGRAA